MNARDLALAVFVSTLAILVGGLTLEAEIVKSDLAANLVAIAVGTTLGFVAGAWFYRGGSGG